MGSIKAPEEEPGYTVGAEEVVSVIGDGVVSATLIGRHCRVGKCNGESISDSPAGNVGAFFGRQGFKVKDGLGGVIR